MAETRRPTVSAAEEILGGYFPVLDHGFVALVDYMGSDDDVERAARVSYGFGTRKVSQTRGLIRYLRRHRHTTPSEMVELKFHVCMPIFVARQWIRHRTANVNEYSGRYSLMPLLFYTPEPRHFALQSADNKQGRRPEGADPGLYEESVRRWEAIRKDAAESYGWMVQNEVARELARIDLPLSTYTQWYWKIDLHNLFHFLSLRVDPHAQYEIRAFGEVMAGMLKRVAPLSYEAWRDYDLAGAPLSRGELAALRHLIAASRGESGVTLTARDGASLDPVALKEHGLSNREVLELADKLEDRPAPDFELDLSVMRSPEEMAETMEEAVPKLELE
ncbi:MAG TPA: FAD-dependent thymidylate synthase [Longimicrobiales bacterium]|nr:FAD-dependent thymidylate synthase [Longimicrobiales bacterium]